MQMSQETSQGENLGRPLSCKTSVLDVQPPEWWESKFVLFETQSLMPCHGSQPKEHTIRSRMVNLSETSAHNAPETHLLCLLQTTSAAVKPEH